MIWSRRVNARASGRHDMVASVPLFTICIFSIDGIYLLCFFFFQAEDGIRDWSVTGVQTCALPILGATEPTRSLQPVVDDAVAQGVQVGESFVVQVPERRPSAEQVESVLEQIGLAPNGRPWDCGACGYGTCQAFAEAAALERTTLKSCPPYLDKTATQAQLQAAEDGLTGLATFRVLRDRLSSEVARSDRTGQPFALLFVDLDNFKQVNDQFGHEAGNEVLRRTALECGSHMRHTDLAARYGGDEFVMVLVHTGAEGAVGVAEKVRSGVEGMGRRVG